MDASRLFAAPDRKWTSVDAVFERFLSLAKNRVAPSGELYPVFDNVVSRAQ